MNRLIRIGILWSLAISIASAQEADTSKDESNQRNPDQPQAEGSASANSKAVVATTMTAETELPANSPISVTLNMRKDESYDKIKQLMEALKDAGVQKMSLRLGGVQYQGKEINQLKVNLQPGYSPAEYEKIDLAAIAVMNRCGLSLLRARNWLPGEADAKHPLDDVNLPVSDSSERTNPAMDSGFIPKSSQTADLRTQYEAANKQAHDLAESLRKTPDAAKKSELRTAVQRAFTLRQSLLRAELQEIQARLEKTQQSLDMRDRSTDQIVDRRVEDLLNPELKWDSSSISESDEQASTPPRYQLLGFRFARDTAKMKGQNEAFESPIITTIVPGSAAEASGFLPGDRVFAVNGLYTWGTDEFIRVVDRQSVGPIECMVLRENSSITLELHVPPEVVATTLANAAQREDSPNTTMVAPVTELEGDWHRVAYIDKWQTERRPVNMTIRANQENSTLWTGGSCSRTVVIDQNAKTIEVGADELKGGRPNQVVSERGTYTLSGDLLTIHSEYTISDAVNGSVIQKGQHTNIWKRGLCKIENYDSRNPGHGMGICHLNGSDENTGLGKLLPGDKVDVLVSFASKDDSTAQRILVENIEVDGSSEPTQARAAERQLRFLGTREQCLIIDDANMRGLKLIVSRKLDRKTQQFPGGINTDAVKEMKEVAPQKSLDVSEPTPFP